MTAKAQTAHDKNGSALFPGDEGLLRFKVVDVREGSILTTSFEPPFREYWFPGTLIERSAQGNASREADRVADAPAAPAVAAATPAPPAVKSSTAREEAIAHVMTKPYRQSGRNHTREEAELIVEEYGTKTILEDREDEKALALGTTGSTGSAVAVSEPAAGDQNQAATSDAATPREGKSAA